ncbi:YncE family protein [Carboxylicivirga sp. M1479]|uniref:YncE family protein n=1 Tax=Carboxylicivirga sp. M1479 TaxID=2594476 RepID=UPI001178BB8B|nr:hypothetical protein [Carboxylicivirga sp. M1479]TRX71351.1 hypothetical protein FNN09_07100 [Carboxylicivirga sp. M1479]
MKKLFVAIGVAAALGLTSCNDVTIYNLEDHQGAYILNKGTTNSTISYYNYEREQCTNDYYQANNSGASIGSGATSIATRKTSVYQKGIAYVTSPTDGNIEMINLDGFKSIGNIDSFTNPTDVSPAEETVIYVAHDDAMVSAYDIVNNTIVESYEVADKPQKMVSSGKYLYVACKGDETGAKVIVIDMSNKVKADTIDLAYDNPIDMAVDIDRKVWVYCDGVDQALVKLDREFKTDTISFDEETLELVDTTYITNEPINLLLGASKGSSDNPLTMSRDGRIVFYVYGHLCSNTIYASPEEGLSTDIIITGDYSSEAFNGIDYDGRTGRLMALTNDGQLVILRWASDVSKWNKEEEYKVGEMPVMTGFNF